MDLTLLQSKDTDTTIALQSRIQQFVVYKKHTLWAKAQAKKQECIHFLNRIW
jgi:hypothetical protein